MVRLDDSLVNWNAEQIRFTAFPTATIDLATATDWWSSFLGQPAPNLAVQQGIFLQASGPVDKGALAISATVAGESRVDFALTPIVLGLEAPSVLGDVHAAVEWVYSLFKKWLDLGIPVRRIGISGVMVAEVASRVEGYRALQPFLPAVRIDPENSSDFAYQINRPRESKSFPALPINRLSRWTVSSRVPMQLGLAPGGFGFVPTSLANDPNFHVRADFDVNTSPLFVAALESSSIPFLMSELLGFLRELQEHGDVP